MKLNNVLSKLGVVILLSMNISFTAFAEPSDYYITEYGYKMVNDNEINTVYDREKPVKVFLNGKETNINGSISAIADKGIEGIAKIIYVDLEDICNNLGYELKWSENNNKVIIKDKFSYVIGTDFITKESEIEKGINFKVSPAKIVNNKLMVSDDIIVEGLNAFRKDTYAEGNDSPIYFIESVNFTTVDNFVETHKTNDNDTWSTTSIHINSNDVTISLGDTKEKIDNIFGVSTIITHTPFGYKYDYPRFSYKTKSGDNLDIGYNSQDRIIDIHTTDKGTKAFGLTIGQNLTYNTRPIDNIYPFRWNIASSSIGGFDGMSVTVDSSNSNKYSNLVSYSNIGFGVENGILKSFGISEELNTYFPETHWANIKFKPSK